MKTSIIYHSYSGITRGIAENIQVACGGDLIEVKLKKNYSSITAYITRMLPCDEGRVRPHRTGIHRCFHF